jgi:glutathione S-transferase
MAATYTLYGSFLSAPTYKVGLMLALCGLKYDYRHIDLAKGQHKSPEFLRVNRYGQVPALVHDGFNMCQANTILEYLAEQTGKFAAASPEERQRVREWLVWETDRLEPGINRSRFFERFAKPDQAVVDYHRKWAEMGLGVLNELMEGKRFLVGERPTIADVSVFGVVAHMAEAKFDIASWPHVKAWWERVTALPGFKLPYDLLPKADQDAA